MLPKKSVHLFRHTFARDWILAGGDEFTLQNLLGHTTSNMTKHYVNIYGKDLKTHNFIILILLTDVLQLIQL